MLLYLILFKKRNFSADFLAKLGLANDIKIYFRIPFEALKSILLSDALRLLYPRA
jgi:hypothetical protein